MLKRQRLSSKLGYQFQNADLLQLALTHRSVHHQHNYERLEFLGDALLGMIIGKYLYLHYPKEQEGRLTRMRASLVRQETLAKVAKDLELGAHLHLGVGELKSGGHHRESILADVVEACIAAIYLDSNDHQTVERCVLNWYQPYLGDVSAGIQLKDPKSRLQEWLQARKLPLPHYELLSIQGDAPKQHFTVQCQVEGQPQVVGEGGSRRFAEQAAAAKILQRLE